MRVTGCPARRLVRNACGRVAANQNNRLPPDEESPVSSAEADETGGTRDCSSWLSEGDFFERSYEADAGNVKLVEALVVGDEEVHAVMGGAGELNGVGAAEGMRGAE